MTNPLHDDAAAPGANGAEGNREGHQARILERATIHDVAERAGVSVSTVSA
ncbi:MAG: LacI family DNA-binding transcriptional regulator, partial [Gemmatirosa sp.]|nr:LacI family DNA-binding transcriptional regulator [Gemmatirosa sp.]